VILCQNSETPIFLERSRGPFVANLPTGVTKSPRTGRRSTQSERQQGFSQSEQQASFVTTLAEIRRPKK
jgi:hypothetical protein